MMHTKEVIVLLLVSVCSTYCVTVGILYEGWHAYAANAMNQVAAKGGVQLAMQDVVESNGAYQISDIYDKYGITPAISASFFYQSKPEAGFYCLYQKRQNETGWGVPDCDNITETATRHAKLLDNAGIDFVTMDGTNIPTMSAQGDVLQLRPMELLFENWAALRQAGINTPKIAAWACLPTGATLWQNYLDLYNNPSYADLVMVDEATGKKVMFSTLNPDSSIVSQVQSNGGRNDVVVQVMWAQLSASAMQSGTWTFFSPCMQNGNFGTSVVGVECQQVLTTNANIGRTKTQMAVSPSYQMSYGSLPFAAPGKLAGLTFKSQFYNAFAAQPDYVFISSFNEFIAQPQPNPYNNVNIGFNMGLPNDPNARSLYVDSYGWEFSRDIEPTEKYGSYIYDLMVACVTILKTGSTTCNDSNSICCQSSDFFSNVYSLKTTPSVSFVDNLLTTSTAEAQKLIASGTYFQLCVPWTGSTVFCADAATPAPQSGPFILYNQQLYPDLTALYRCLETGTARHFISPSSTCEGQTTESVLGFISSVRGRETFRALYRCLDHTTQAHYHSLDLACPPADEDTGLLGYVR